jgi:hypothetical protein
MPKTGSCLNTERRYNLTLPHNSQLTTHNSQLTTHNSGMMPPRFIGRMIAWKEMADGVGEYGQEEIARW